MSTTYYWDPTVSHFQPERRHNPPDPSRTSENRRRTSPIFTTSDQFMMLKDALESREVQNGSLGRQNRILRHLLFAVSALYIFMYFAKEQASSEGQIFVDTAFGSVATKVTGPQVSAVIPFVLTYLVLWACWISAKRLKIQHECRLIGLALERFGCQTSYFILGTYREACSSRLPFNSLWNRPREYLKFITARHLYRLGERLYQAQIVFSVVLTFVACIDASLPLYRDMRATHPFPSKVLLLLLGLSVVSSAVATGCLWLSRGPKQRYLEEHMELLRSDPRAVCVPAVCRDPRWDTGLQVERAAPLGATPATSEGARPVI